jgi:hypothetical protein
MGALTQERASPNNETAAPLAAFGASVRNAAVERKLSTALLPIG